MPDPTEQLADWKAKTYPPRKATSRYLIRVQGHEDRYELLWEAPDE